MSHLTDINSAYQKLNVRANTLYEFVILYHNYIYAHHTYENENFNMMEIHTLTYIDDCPGITATELSKLWHKSKSAISQVIKRLVDSGYVEKRSRRTMRNPSVSMRRIKASVFPVYTRHMTWPTLPRPHLI